jgi:hypothetical protein
MGFVHQGGPVLASVLGLLTIGLDIIVIVANNYTLYPYLSIFTDKVRVLDLPDKPWQFMEIGVGGYIIGRTAEKVRGRSEARS